MCRAPALALALALFTGSFSGVRAGGTISSTLQIAAAINGNIVLFRTDGSGSRVLTQGGIDGSPVVSPDGRMVAFLRWPGGRPPNSVAASRHIMMVAAPGAGTSYTIRRFSPRSPLTVPGRAALAWQPGARPAAISWYEAGNIVLRPIGQPARGILNVGPAPFGTNSSPIAWSPDGQEVAAPTAVGQSAGYPTTLHVVVGNPAAQTERTITIRFRPGVLSTGSDPVRGSFPVGDDLAFADNHHLLVATVGKGAGYQLTGVFIVPDTGGTARMVLGNGNGVHNTPPFAPPLAGATRFQLSPNGKFTATDPNNHFWISGAVAAPRSIPVPLGPSCVLSQWTWLPDSSGLAYVTACTVAGVSPLHYRLTLATVAVTAGPPRLRDTVSLTSGPPRVLDTVLSQNQQAIDLAPAYRCVACG